MRLVPLNYNMRNTGVIADEFERILGLSDRFGDLVGAPLLFYAPLLTSVIPEIAQDSTVTTPPAATVRTITDHEGVIRYANVGEMRFKGARRVENLLADPIGDWNPIGDVTVNADGSVTMSVDGDATDRSYMQLAQSVSAGAAYFLSFTIDECTATAAVQNGFVTLIGLTTNPPNRTPNPWNPADGQSGRIAIKFDIPATDTDLDGTIRLGFGTTASAIGIGETATVTIRNVMLEEISGAGVEAPSEYVDPAVDYGVTGDGSVLGVRYFDTENANAWDDEAAIVVEAAGAAIAADTLKGLFAEPAHTNIVDDGYITSIQNYAATGTVWSDDGEIAPDGRAVAETLTEDGTTGAHSASRTNVGTHTANTNVTASIFCKPGSTFAADRTLLLRVRWSAGTIGVHLDPVTGIVGEIEATGTGVAAAFGGEPLADGWWRIWITGKENGGSDTTPNFVFGMANGGLQSYTGDGATSAHFFGVNCVEADNVSTYIPISGARASDEGVAFHIDNLSVLEGSHESQLTMPIASADSYGTDTVFWDGNDPNARLVYGGAGLSHLRMRTAGARVTKTDALTFAAGETLRVRGRYSATTGEANIAYQNESGTAADDGSPLTDFTALAPAGSVRVLVNIDEHDGAGPIGVSIKGLKLWGADKGDPWLSAAS